MWLLFALLAALLWGINYTLTEKILRYISPMTLLALEMLAGAAMFCSIAYFTSWQKDKLTLSSNPQIVWLTLIEIGVVLFASFFIVVSINGKNATVAGIIEIIYPLFIILFSWLFFGENHVSLSVLIGGTLIFAGVLIIGFE